MLIIFSALKNEKLGNCTPALNFFQGAKTTDLFSIISYQYFHLCTFNFEGMGCLTGAARIAGAETLEAAYLTRPRQQLQRPSTSPWCGVAHDAGNIYLFLADSLPVFQLCNHKKNSKSDTNINNPSFWILILLSVVFYQRKRTRAESDRSALLKGPTTPWHWNVCCMDPNHHEKITARRVSYHKAGNLIEEISEEKRPGDQHKHVWTNVKETINFFHWKILQKVQKGNITEKKRREH